VRPDICVRDSALDSSTSGEGARGHVIGPQLTLASLKSQPAGFSSMLTGSRLAFRRWGSIFRFICPPNISLGTLDIRESSDLYTP